MATCKPDVNEFTEIMLKNKKYYVDEDQLQKIKAIVGGGSYANPFWTKDDIYEGAKYYLIDEDPLSDVTHGAFEYDDFAVEDVNLERLEFVKTETFAKIQYWREKLYRRLVYFKYQNDNGGAESSKLYSIMVTYDENGRPEGFSVGSKYVQWVGEVYFFSREIATRAIHEVVYPTMLESGLSAKDQWEIVRVF